MSLAHTRRHSIPPTLAQRRPKTQFDVSIFQRGHIRTLELPGLTRTCAAQRRCGTTLKYVWSTAIALARTHAEPSRPNTRFDVSIIQRRYTTMCLELILGLTDTSAAQRRCVTMLRDVWSTAIAVAPKRTTKHKVDRKRDVTPVSANVALLLALSFEARLTYTC